MARSEKPIIGSELVPELCDYLALRGHFFWRSNNVPVYDPARGAFRTLPKYTMKGLPDIIVLKDGKFIGIEAKAGTGRLSPDQVEFGRLCNRNGEYIVAHSIDDLVAAGI